MCSRRSLWLPILMIMAGCVFLLQNLGYWYINFSRLWPLWLIAVGLMMMSDSGRRRARSDSEAGERHE